jgi:hypothetical protein
VQARTTATLRACISDMRAVMERIGAGDADAVRRLEDEVLTKALAFADLLRQRIEKLDQKHHLNGLALFAALACGVPCVEQLLPTERRAHYVAALANVQHGIANESMRSKLFLPNATLARNMLYMLVHHGAGGVPPLDAHGTLLATRALVAPTDMGPAHATWTLWRLCEAWLRVLHISGMFDRLSSGEVNQDVHSNPMRAARALHLVPSTFKQQRQTVHCMRLQVSTATEAVAIVLCMIQSMYLPFEDAPTPPATPQRAAHDARRDGPTDSDEDDDDVCGLLLLQQAMPSSAPRGAAGAQPLLPLGGVFRLLEVKPSAVKARMYSLACACVVVHDSTIARDTVLPLHARMRACGRAHVDAARPRTDGRGRVHSYLARLGDDMMLEQRARRGKVSQRADASQRNEQQTAFRLVRKLCRDSLVTGITPAASSAMAALPLASTASVTKAAQHIRAACAPDQLPTFTSRTVAARSARRAAPEWVA